MVGFFFFQINFTHLEKSVCLYFLDKMKNDTVLFIFMNEIRKKCVHTFTFQNYLCKQFI